MRPLVTIAAAPAAGRRRKRWRTTAFDEYAIRAFEVNALDYLLKPIAPARLAAALDRVRRTPAAAAHARLERVFVRDGERCWIVSVADIRLLESEGNYARRIINLRWVGRVDTGLDGRLVVTCETARRCRSRAGRRAACATS